MWSLRLRPGSRSWRAFLVIAAVGLSFGCGSGPHLNRVAPEGLDLSGRWALNLQDSDDLSQFALPGRGTASFGSTQTGGRPNPGAGGPVVAEANYSANTRATMHLALRRPAILTLEQSDSVVVVRGDANFSLRLPTAGGRLDWVHQPPRGQRPTDDIPVAKVKTVAGWDHRSMIVVHDLGGGGRIVRHYRPAPSNNQLFVITSVDLGGERPIEFRSVYDRRE